VTLAEYRRFMDDAGYSRWDLQRLVLADGPALFYGTEQPAQQNAPVCGISWHEAMAYCDWLTEQGYAAGWLPRDATLRLPTSLEWERAARHTDQRRYPWGTREPDNERVHGVDNNDLNAPVPVGCYPAGAAACGALDMAGNVGEWLATSQDEPAALQPDNSASGTLLLSYNDYIIQPEKQCCGSRSTALPAVRLHLYGFRVVWVPHSGSTAINEDGVNR
jgi:formylglycine-generating enzyme required for sulfatase activity